MYDVSVLSSKVFYNLEHKLKIGHGLTIKEDIVRTCGWTDIDITYHGSYTGILKCPEEAVDEHFVTVCK